ncbi:MAG: branched-chain amino acid ABC transporter permease [Betaproteobacteria bacterium]|nr:branched-chain amino acid ABC transporter permease [Betaproteobacteria bacterium]
MQLTRERIFALAMLVLLIAFPIAMNSLDEAFYIGFGSRIMIYAIAATSLNLILGYGGMISFGHAAFLGAGAYVVGILMAEGVASAWISWPAAVVVSGLFALAIGAISLRTHGVYFIMITLAFAQMMYYIFISLKAYGGEDGLNMPARSDVGFGIDLKNDVTFYYVVLVFLVLSLYLLHRLIHARFGRVVEAIRENETRMETIGFPTYRYKLICFVIAGALCGLAGALLANQNSFVSPKLMEWTLSGTLMIMVILGGVGYHYGGAVGALVMLVLEEVLSVYTIYWQLPVGIILLVIVLFAPRGIAGAFSRRAQAKGH